MSVLVAIIIIIIIVVVVVVTITAIPDVCEIWSRLHRGGYPQVR